MFDLRRYQEAVLSGHILSDGTPPVAYAALGLASEAGEVAALLQKGCYAGAEAISVGRMLEEMGDVLNFLSYLSGLFGFGIDELARMNAEKLALRYPERYAHLVSPETEVVDG